MEIELTFNALDGPLDIITHELADVPGVQRVEIGTLTMPPLGAKGALPISDLSLKIVPAAFGAVLRAANTALRRLTAAPTAISINHKDGSIKITYDPRYETSDDISAMMAALLEADARHGRRPV